MQTVSFLSAVELCPLFGIEKPCCCNYVSVFHDYFKINFNSSANTVCRLYNIQTLYHNLHSKGRLKRVFIEGAFIVDVVQQCMFLLLPCVISSKIFV